MRATEFADNPILAWINPSSGGRVPKKSGKTPDRVVFQPDRRPKHSSLIWGSWSMMQVQKSRSTSEVRESVYLAVVDGLVLVGIEVRVPTTFQREPFTCLIKRWHH